MKKYKYVLGVSMLGLFSQVSATAAAVLEAAADKEPYSPAGYHGTRNGGMVKGLPGSASAASFSVATVCPTALQFLIPQDNGTYTPTAVLSFSSGETVHDLKARIIEGYRLPAAIRFMVGRTEVMNSDVVNGELVLLKDAFAGRSGIVEIKIVKDNTRSPLHSAMPSPQPRSPSDSALKLILPPAAK